MGIGIGACAQQIAAPSLAAYAAGSHHCDYTYIHDVGFPEIGEGGKLKYDSAWWDVISDGWTLKSAHPDSGVYLFERCR
jgi:hypothetical protein